MDINKFVNPNQDRSIFHTSGYAEVAHGDLIGATSSESFQRRRHIERNRTSVRRYGDSMLATGHMREGTSGRERQRFSGRPHSLNIAPRVGFQEPPGRHYNPFS